MKYATPYDIGIGDNVTYKGNNYDVLINYIKGDKDRKGFVPTENFTILINNNGKRITCHDYTQLEVIKQITDHGRLI